MTRAKQNVMDGVLFIILIGCVKSVNIQLSSISVEVRLLTPKV